MIPRRALSALLFSFVFAPAALAGWVCDEHPEWCVGRRSSPKGGSSQVSNGSSLRLNPSAVPVEKGLGLEGIYYDRSVDVSLVKGLGRVGAGFSPTSGEDTYFGAPGFEEFEDFQERKYGRSKYRSGKITVATAVNLVGNKRKGIKRAEVNLGLMAKYSPVTRIGTPGGGLSAVLGPFTLGYSAYRDQALLGPSSLEPQERPRIFMRVETYSVGLFLTSFAFDHSILRQKPELSDDTAVVKMWTATLFLPKALITMSKRDEDSDRWSYDFGTEVAGFERKKSEYFGGLQVYAGNHALVGVFYNYYLLREISIGLTLFF